MDADCDTPSEEAFELSPNDEIDGTDNEALDSEHGDGLQEEFEASEKVEENAPECNRVMVPILDTDKPSVQISSMTEEDMGDLDPEVNLEEDTENNSPKSDIVVNVSPLNLVSDNPSMDNVVLTLHEKETGKVDGESDNDSPIVAGTKMTSSDVIVIPDVDIASSDHRDDAPEQMVIDDSHSRELANAIKTNRKESASTSNYVAGSPGLKRRPSISRQRQKRMSVVKKMGRTRRLSAQRREQKLQDLVDSITMRIVKRTRFMTIKSCEHAPWLEYWVMLLMLGIVYLSSTIPYRLAFGVDDTGWIISLVLDILFELIFIFDIFLSFHLSYLDERGVEVSNPTLIKQRYMEGWFFFDIIVTLPLDMGLTKVGAVLQLLKVLRIFHVFGRMSVLERNGGLQAAISRAVKLGFSFFLVFHFVGCIWFAFSTFGEFGETEFVPSKALQSEPGFTQYMQSIFWALSLLSNTSIPEGRPITNVESFFTVLSMTAGMGAVSYVVGSVGAWMEQRNFNHQLHDRRLRDVLQFLNFNEVDYFLKKQVTSYLSYKWAANRGFDREQMFNRLPMSLNTIVSTALARNIMDRVPIFSLLSEDAMSSILMKLQPTLLVPGQYVFRKGQRATDMFFIHMGEVEAISHTDGFRFDCDDDENERHTMAVESVTAPSSFGMAEVLISKTYPYSTRSCSFADVFMLNTDDMFCALEPFPDEFQLIMNAIDYNRKRFESRNTSLIGSMLQSASTETSTPSFNTPYDMSELERIEIVGTLKLHQTSSTNFAESRPSRFTISSGHHKKVIRQSKARVRPKLTKRMTSSPLLGVAENEAAITTLSMLQYFQNLVVFPQSRFGRVWKKLVTLLNLYNVLIIPYRITFSPHLVSVPLLIIDYFGDVIYLIDIYVNFHLAFLRAGQLVSTLNDIQEHYYSTKFFRQAISSLPLDLIMLFIGMTPTLRSLRLLRIKDLSDVLFDDPHSPEERPWKTLTRKVGILLVVFFLGAHYVACCYFSFTYINGYGNDENIWLPPKYLENDPDHLQQYLYSLYFAYNILLRLGVGIVPRSSTEVLFTIVVLLCGVVVVAQLIASFSAFLQIYDHGESHFKQSLSLLSNYLYANGVPSNIHARVIDFYRFEWRDFQGADMNTALDPLPLQLRRDVMVNICLPALQRVKPLVKLPQPFLVELSYGMKFYSISKGEQIYCEDAVADALFIVRRGRVDLHLDLSDNTRALQAVVMPGRYFGDEILKFRSWRELSAVAGDHTHMLRLDVSHLESVLIHHPGVETTLRDIARAEKEKEEGKNRS